MAWWCICADFWTAWSHQVLLKMYLAWLSCTCDQPGHDKLWKGPKINFCCKHHIFYWFMVLALHAPSWSSQVVPWNLERGVSVTSHQSRSIFFPLLDSLHVKCWVDTLKEENYDQYDMLRKVSEPDLICHVATVLPWMLTYLSNQYNLVKVKGCGI